MARARTIKHGFFTNDELVELPPLVRLLFAGLWTIADREGRLLDRPKKIRLDVMPGDDFDVDDALAQLAAHGFLLRYVVDGVACIQILNWSKHQKPHPREAASEIPAPGTGQGPATELASNAGLRSPVSIPSGPEPSGPLAEAAATEPALAEALVDGFYEAIGVAPHSLTRSHRKREVSIAAQLVEAGAKLDEARRFVAWCRDGPYRPVPSDLRVYEQRRAQFQAHLEPVAAGPPGRRNGTSHGMGKDEQFTRGIRV